MEAQDELPLLDEVAVLLEKEKTLLNLQLLEQNIEAQEWKAKYEQLVNKVALENEGNVTAYAIAANVETSDLWKRNLDGILHHFAATNEAFLSIDHIPISKIELKRIARVLATSNISMLRLSHCDLSDEVADEVAGILTKHRCSALDFSNNDIGATFLGKLLQTFRHHHQSPQYVCLDGNLNLGQTGVNTLIPHLTHHTWGLSLTLVDFSTPILQSKSKPPGQCSAFLKQFNHHLSTPQTSKQLATDSLQQLNVLCLRNAQMSKESIKLLGVTVGQLTVASLAHLDLSFSYIGYAGAQMLSKVIASPTCNLVRLCAAGCYFGDAEVSVLADGLHKNKSLVYLSLHGNHITNTGIRTLGSTLPQLRVMQRIVVSNNWCDASAVREANITAKHEGALARLIWNKDDIPINNDLYPLYAQSRKVSGVVDNAYGYTTLYSISSKLIRLPSLPVSLHVHWTMHPCNEDIICEIVTEHSQGSPVVAREHVPAFSGYAACDAVVPPLPIGAVLHLRCYVKGGVRVAAYGLSILEYKSTEPCILYKDSAMVSPVMLRITHSAGVASLPNDFTVTRQYTHHAPSSVEPLRFTWESKLTALTPLNAAKEPISTWKTPGGMLLGYEWCIFVCRFGGKNWEVVASGEVLPVTSEGPQELLSPWLWSSIQAEAPMLQRGDRIVLGFKTTNNKDVHHLCEVLVKDFQVDAPGDIFEGCEADGASKKFQESFPAVVHLNYNFEDTELLKYLI